MLLQYLPQGYYLVEVVTFAILSVFSYLFLIFAKKAIGWLVISKLRVSSTHFGRALAESSILYKFSYLAPALLFYNFAFSFSFMQGVVEAVSAGIMALVLLFIINDLITLLEQVYRNTKYSEQFNIKSYVQITKLIINLLGTVVVLSVLMGKNPTLLLSGIGAMTAVLILVFKDTILSLVASMVISSNDLFKVGDWIEVPQFDANGDVIEIALHKVKIQNFDKTISVIPTHKFIDSPFKNWRGMTQSGGRRIKRSIAVDMTTISICDQDLLNKLRKIDLLKDYMETGSLSGQYCTNIGFFRIYIKKYLRANGNICQKGMTFLVRELEPTAQGLPIQVYVFVNDTNWARYEDVQADIFDHLLAIMPEFGLKVFQEPTD